MASRTIVVGDIHGCYDELMKLLKKAKFKQSDRVVSVGDLVSKGPKVREVLDLFISDKRFSTLSVITISFFVATGTAKTLNSKQVPETLTRNSDARKTSICNS
jgi:Icc-related predicted phosphoesterase